MKTIIATIVLAAAAVFAATVTQFRAGTVSAIPAPSLFEAQGGPPPCGPAPLPPCPPKPRVAKRKS